MAYSSVESLHWLFSVFVCNEWVFIARDRVCPRDVQSVHLCSDCRFNAHFFSFSCILFYWRREKWFSTSVLGEDSVRALPKALTNILCAPLMKETNGPTKSKVHSNGVLFDIPNYYRHPNRSHYSLNTRSQSKPPIRVFCGNKWCGNRSTGGTSVRSKMAISAVRDPTFEVNDSYRR